ncbi:hypothetical protein ACH5RR_000584 [Cinchona calisaya]|uniref:Uncharacterized protein n=1 Tax=Cinchona calisaya TaxID=153742 RepID=A0ABD3B157_9GENT
MKKSNNVDWPYGNLTKPPPDSSSRGSPSPYPNINTTINSDFKSSSQRTSSPFHLKIKISSSTKEVQSSFPSWHAPESGSSLKGSCSSPRVHVKQMNLGTINMFPSRFTTGDVNKGKFIDKIVELLEEKMSISETHKRRKKRSIIVSKIGKGANIGI